MDFRFSDDQRAIADMAASLFAGDGADPPAWDKLSDAGLPALLLPEVQGGVGLGFIELALVLIEQGRGFIASPLWRHALAALALGEAEGRSTVALHGTISVAGERLSGTLPTVIGLAGADRLILAGDEVLYAIDLASLRRSEGVLTDDQPAEDLTLDNILGDRLPYDAVWLRARAAACLAALAVGVARGALERTAAYVSERQQFGRALGSFQAVAQRLADAFTDVEVSQTLAFELAWKLDSGAPLDSAAEVATYWANQCAHRVAHTAMHLHGGIGADTSYPIHRGLMLARALELELGGVHRQLAVLGAGLAA